MSKFFNYGTSLQRLFLLILIATPNLYGAETLVAVATNFTAPAKKIVQAFELTSEHKAILSFGSTGKLYAQIANGAPFDLFLAADAERPAKAIQQGLAVAGSAFTYAEGKIVLFSLDPKLVDAEGAVLRSQDSFSKIAIANPKIAPYGKAAIQLMRHLGVYDEIEHKVVTGANIAQTYQFIMTRNAQLGFVSLSQLTGSNNGSHWTPSEHLYPPIQQDAVLLLKGEGNEAASAFLEFLKGPEALEIIEYYGYSHGRDDPLSNVEENRMSSTSLAN